MYTKYTVWAFGPKRPPQFHDDGAAAEFPAPSDPPLICADCYDCVVRTDTCAQACD